MRPTARAKRLVAKLESTSGWRARQEILNDLGKVRLSFAATEAPEERREWLTVLDYLNDGIAEAIALRDTIKRHMQ
jgi:hypothetical protein